MNVYDQMLAIFDQRGWCKGAYEDESGRVCLSRALTMVVRSTPRNDVARLKIDRSARREIQVLMAELYPSRAHLLTPLSMFNDNHHTTFEDVRTLLEKASARFDELRGFEVEPNGV